MVDGGLGVHQGAVVVGGEPLALKAQIIVHILPVIEPAVAGVYGKCVIAYIFQQFGQTLYFVSYKVVGYLRAVYIFWK